MIPSLALLGPPNTFSDLAASAYLEKQSQKFNKIYCPSISEIFTTVLEDPTTIGLSPQFNKLAGEVGETIQNLAAGSFEIINEITLPIHHCLIILKSATPSHIKTILSHPQALAQCSDYLQQNFPAAHLKEAPSTAAAVKELLQARDDSLAAIAGKQALTPELQIHASSIENQENWTNFIVFKQSTA